MLRKENIRLFEEISDHLLKDEKPSLYLKTIPEDNVPFDMFRKLKETEQSKKHHPEGNVWNHTLLVVDEAAKVREKSKGKKAFMWAALLHDIGKPETTVIKGEKVTAYNHDRAGVKRAIEFLSFLTEDSDFIDKVAALIRWHMQILFVVNDLPFQNIAEMKRSGDIEEIALLGYCDRIGRLSPDIKKEKNNIKIFLDRCKKH